MTFLNGVIMDLIEAKHARPEQPLLFLRMHVAQFQLAIGQLKECKEAVEEGKQTLDSLNDVIRTHRIHPLLHVLNRMSAALPRSLECIHHLCRLPDMLEWITAALLRSWLDWQGALMKGIVPREWAILRFVSVRKGFAGLPEIVGLVNLYPHSCTDEELSAHVLYALRATDSNREATLPCLRILLHVVFVQESAGRLFLCFCLCF